MSEQFRQWFNERWKSSGLTSPRLKKVALEFSLDAWISRPVQAPSAVDLSNVQRYRVHSSKIYEVRNGKIDHGQNLAFANYDFIAEPDLVNLSPLQSASATQVPNGLNRPTSLIDTMIRDDRYPGLIRYIYRLENLLAQKDGA